MAANNRSSNWFLSHGKHPMYYGVFHPSRDDLGAQNKGGKRDAFVLVHGMHPTCHGASNDPGAVLNRPDEQTFKSVMCCKYYQPDDKQGAFYMGDPKQTSGDRVMTNELMASIAKRLPEESGIKIPPNVFLEMDGEMIEYEAGKSLTVKFPVKEKYQNPFGFMQGGMIVAAVDNTIGPLSMLEASPSVTTQLNTTYIRPIAADQGYIFITATVVDKTKRTLHIQADVRNEMGKLCVKCFASCSTI